MDERGKTAAYTTAQLPRDSAYLRVADTTPETNPIIATTTAIRGPWSLSSVAKSVNPAFTYRIARSMIQTGSKE